MSAIEFTSTIHPQPNGARVELGVVHHQGHTFSALGSVVDPAEGILVGYPNRDASDGKLYLTTWSGERIAPLAEPSTWKAWFGGQRFTMYAWGCLYQGRRYSGRNGGVHFGGEGCLLRMRAGAHVEEGR